METLNKFFLETLEWTWVYEYAAIIIIAAAVLLLALLITIIVAAVTHSKKNKKIRVLQEKSDSIAAVIKTQTDNGELRAKIREEIEPIVREQVENEYASKAPMQDKELVEQLDQLNATIEEKNRRIEELGEALAKSNNSHDTDNTELLRTINNLKEENNDLRNKLNIAKAEKAALATETKKATEPAVRAEATETEEVAKPRPAARTRRPVKAAAPEPAPAPAPAPQPVVDDEDDYGDDEYYDDYGGADSDIKVTLKFDRIKNNWVINRSDTARTYRRLETKTQALPIAKDLAKRLHAQLVVHKKDGKFQKI